MNASLGTTGLTELEGHELAQVDGGWFAGPLVGAAIALIKTIESNPDSFSWTMDWYYDSSYSEASTEGPYSILNRV